MKIMKNILIVFTFILKLISLQVRQTNSECCRSTVVHFHINSGSKKSCSDFPSGARVHFSNTFCYVKLCGRLKRATPCCGVHRCNIFCCNCTCWARNSRVLVDFRTEYWTEIHGAYMRSNSLIKQTNAPYAFSLPYENATLPIDAKNSTLRAASSVQSLLYGNDTLPIDFQSSIMKFSSSTYPSRLLYENAPFPINLSL